jgi:hypothetical protein
MTPREVTERIAAELKAGTLDRRQAEALLGFVLLEALAIRGVPVESPKATYYRRCGELRRVGLLSGRTNMEPVNVEFDSPVG